MAYEASDDHTAPHWQQEIKQYQNLRLWSRAYLRGDPVPDKWIAYLKDFVKDNWEEFGDPSKIYAIKKIRKAMKLEQEREQAMQMLRDVGAAPD